MSGRRARRNVRQRGGGRVQAVEAPILAAETFEVRNPERELFNSLNARTVVRPSVVNWNEWLELRDNNDAYAAYFVDKIRLLGLENIAMVNESISKQLLLEFYLTFNWTSSSSFTVRLNSVERPVSADLFHHIFGFRCQRDHSNPTDPDYNEKTFWDSIRTDADWADTTGYALTYVESNNLYMIYRFFARCVLNKDDPSRMNHEELYLLWCLLYKPDKAEIFPHIWEVIRRRQTTTARFRPNPLCLGSFVTVLAKHFHWIGPALDDYTPTTRLVFNTRELHVGGDTESWVVYVMAPPRTRAPNRRQTPRARTAEPEANDGEGNVGGGDAREVYVPGSGFMPDFGANFETGSSSRSRAYTLEDIWNAHESTRTELLTVRDELRGTRAELAAYRGEVSNYHADIDRYQENVLGYREAVEANTVAYTEYRAAVEANTLAIQGYRNDVEARGTAHDEMFRVMMERLGLNGPPPPPPN